MNSLIQLLGAIASLVGIPLALVSVLQTRHAARKSAREAEASKEAALQAKAEVEKFREELRLISNVVDFEKALALMDDIKSLIRHSAFTPVPDKIAALIVLLNTVRSPSMSVSDQAKRDIQGSVLALRKIEDAIHRSLVSNEEPKGMINFNKQISEQIDTLQPILIDLRNRIGEQK